MSAPDKEEFEVRELVVAHQSVWDAIEELARQRNCSLTRIPNFADDPDDILPAYIFTPNDFRKEAS